LQAGGIFPALLQLQEDAMLLSRRQFVRFAAGGLALPVLSCVARAQEYPARPVHLIVGLAAGSSPDIVGRLIAQSLSERLGYPFVVENRVGAGGTVAAGLVARAEPDGYSLLLISSSNAVSAALYKDLDYNLARDIVPVCGICTSPNIMVVHPSFPAKTIADFIAYAKANPGKINMASAGVGTETHVAGELFKKMAGIDMTHVPYRGGGPALRDLVAGQVQVAFPSSSAAFGYIKSGSLRALGVSTPTRLANLPDVPAIAEFLPGFEASGWFGIGAPKNTPAAIVDKLHRETSNALTDSEVKARLSDLGDMPGMSTGMGSATEFGQLIVEETEKWAKLAEAANIMPE
jgi:tripartite-type tricarboxylate transporter receptor subunit TctC